jgi:hypothetical protein
MGNRGPVPERSDRRRRENKPEIDIETAPGASRVEVPEPLPGWHPIALAWYGSLARSGQSFWYQPSDWAEAVFLAEVMSEALLSGPINGPKLSAILSGSSRLMTTEGDRRRMRIELAKPVEDEDENAAVTALDDYRARFAN